jgi:hypothetical protein
MNNERSIVYIFAKLCKLRSIALLFGCPLTLTTGDHQNYFFGEKFCIYYVPSYRLGIFILLYDVHHQFDYSFRAFLRVDNTTQDTAISLAGFPSREWQEGNGKLSSGI